ncbi:MAG: xanthine dehydrogenase family protein molybdopterin-binding subunit [SAR324 cluster bacterium]
MDEPFQTVGHDAPRQGLAGKVLGVARYTADLKRPGMLHAKVLRSPHAHARIVSIDTSAAARAPGVGAVLTWRDAPEGRVDADLGVLEPELRFVGDEVAAVAAETLAQAEDALDAIRVQYEALPAVFDAEQALAAGAPPVHPGGNLIGQHPLVEARGDVAAGFAQAARIFEGTFRTQVHAPVGMETRAALAEWDGASLTVWKTSRSPHANDRQMLARVCGVPPERVRVICPNMGGGFGNKDESRCAALAALLARKAGRPVRLEYTRPEEFLGGRNRQSSVNRLRIGIAADGAPLAIELRSAMNAGAYVASGRNVVRRIGQGALYLYRCPNARFEGTAVYTHRPAGGSFRALGAPLGHFALEALVDQVAASLGVDPLDYRLRFGVPPAGQPGSRRTPPGQPLPDEPVEGGVPFSSNGLRACLLAGAERIGWRTRRQPNGTATGPRRRGIGMAMGIYKGGVGREAQADVALTRQGRVAVNVGIVDVGQGSQTVLAQIAAETLHMPLERVDVTLADTAKTPPGHITAGSSTTFSSGSAVKAAAETVLNRLRERAAALLGATDAVLEGARLTVPGDPGRSISLDEAVARIGEDLSTRAVLTVGSTDHIVNSFAAHFAEVEVEMETGRIRILRYVAAHDSGRIVNSRLAASQVSGGVLQFLGIALREELYLDPVSGVTLNPSFLEHKSTAIVDFPPIETIFAGEPDPAGPYGAKALGEPPAVPVLGAVTNAVANATGIWLHEAPFTPQRVLDAIRSQGRHTP